MLLNIAIILAILLNLFLMALVYVKGAREKQNGLLLLFTGLITLFFLFIFFIYQFPAAASVFSLVSMSFAVWGCYFWLIYVRSMLLRRLDRTFLAWTIAVPGVITGLLWGTKLIVDQMYIVDQHLVIVDGPYVGAYSIYYLVLLAIMCGSFMVYSVRERDTLQRARIVLIGISMVTCFLGMFVLAEVLPVYLGETRSIKVVPLSGLILVAGMIYGIIRYTYGSIIVIISEKRFFSGSSAVLVFAGLSILLLVALRLLQRTTVPLEVCVLLCPVFFVCYAGVHHLLERTFKRDRLTYDQAVGYINDTIVAVDDLDTFKEKVGTLITTIFKPEHYTVVIAAEERGDRPAGVYLVDNAPELFTAQAQDDAVMVLAIKERQLGRIYLKLNPQYLNFTKENLDLCKVFAQEISVVLVSVRTAEENKQKQAQLFQTEKAALLGQLTAGIVHEIRNPLSAVAITLENVLECLRETTYDPGTIDRLEKMGKASIEEMKKFLAAFLDFSRREDIAKAPVNVAELLEGALLIIRKTAQKHGVRISQTVPADLYLYADPNKIKQVFLNLFLNAVDAMPAGGTLTVTATAQHTQAQIIVADTGTGIPAEKIQEIFQPFYTTKPHGTGLGLTIVKEIIDLHQGRLQVESTPAAGTRFILEVPLFELHK